MTARRWANVLAGVAESHGLSLLVLRSSNSGGTPLCGVSCDTEISRQSRKACWVVLWDER